MTACIIYPNLGSGLFSLFNNVIAHMEVYDDIEVKWNPKHTPYNAIPVANLWDLISSYNGVCTNKPDVKHSHSPIMHYTSKNAGFRYLQDNGWREKLYEQLYRVVYQPEIEAILTREVDLSILKNSIAIQHRSSQGIAAEQLTQKVVPITTLIRAANRVDNKTNVFVACDSHKSYDEFKSILGDRMFTFNCLGWSNQNGEFHFEEPCGIEHIQGMMAQAIALSCCKHLVHGVSNIATAALYMNPDLPNSFVQG